jgi:hypothetical protein
VISVAGPDGGVGVYFDLETATAIRWTAIAHVRFDCSGLGAPPYVDAS